MPVKKSLYFVGWLGFEMTPPHSQVYFFETLKVSVSLLLLSPYL